MFSLNMSILFKFKGFRIDRSNIVRTNTFSNSHISTSIVVRPLNSSIDQSET